MPTLLCHIAWMPEYNGESDIYTGNFGQAVEDGYHEALNFASINGRTYGYVQARNGTINILRLGARMDAQSVDDVTVIWTAPEPGPNGQRKVVGWYRNARVHRSRLILDNAARIRNQTNYGYSVEADTAKCTLVEVVDRGLSVPNTGTPGLPGISPVFFAEDSENPIMQRWLKEAATWMNEYDTVAEPAVRKRRGGGWPASPDISQNAAVELAAVIEVRKKISGRYKSREADNCGWDCEFTEGTNTLCIEVKGLSGAEVSVQITPNEFLAMEAAMAGRFRPGEYRLAVVTNALDHPKLHMFRWESGDVWQCERTRMRITLTRRTGASLS